MSAPRTPSPLRLHRSPASKRVYLLARGTVVGEVPLQAEPELGDEPVVDELDLEAEAAYTRRKLGNLHRFNADLGQLRAALASEDASFVSRSGDDILIESLALYDFTKVPAALRPRLAQLGNSGWYILAQGGWYHLVRPTSVDVGMLRRVPNIVLAGDHALDAFAARYQARVRIEAEVARALLDALERVIGHGPEVA